LVRKNQEFEKQRINAIPRHLANHFFGKPEVAEKNWENSWAGRVENRKIEKRGLQVFGIAGFFPLN